MVETRSKRRKPLLAGMMSDEMKGEVGRLTGEHNAQPLEGPIARRRWPGRRLAHDRAPVLPWSEPSV